MKKIFFILGLLAFSACGTRDVADRDNYDDDRRDHHHDDHRDDDDYDDDRRPWWVP